MAQRRAADEPWAGGIADGELVGRTLAGDRDAFAVLFDRYARQVYSIAYRISGNPSDAEDLTQETFLRALRTLHTLRDRQAIGGWLSRVATHACIDASRHRGKLSQAELSDAVVNAYPDGSRSPQDAILSREDQRAVWAALERLSESQRTALTLREMQGLSYAAIAREMGLSLAAVEVLIFRARRRFREHYEKLVAGGLPDTKPLRCKEARKALATALDGEGSAEERRTVLAHVRACPACRAEIAAQRVAARRRAALPLLPLPPALAQPFAPPVSPVAPPITPPPSVPLQPVQPVAPAMPAGPVPAMPAPPPINPLPIPAPPPVVPIGAGTAAATGTALGAKVAVLGGAKAALLAAGAAAGIAVSGAPIPHLPPRAIHPVVHRQAPARHMPATPAHAPARPINRVPAQSRAGIFTAAIFASGVTTGVKMRVWPVPSAAAHQPAPAGHIAGQTRSVSHGRTRSAGHSAAHTVRHRALPRPARLAPARPAPAPPAAHTSAAIHIVPTPPRRGSKAGIALRSPSIAGRHAPVGKRLRPRSRPHSSRNPARVQPQGQARPQVVPGHAHSPRVRPVMRRHAQTTHPALATRGHGHKVRRISTRPARKPHRPSIRTSLSRPLPRRHAHDGRRAQAHRPKHVKARAGSQHPRSRPDHTAPHRQAGPGKTARAPQRPIHASPRRSAHPPRRATHVAPRRPIHPRQRPTRAAKRRPVHAARKPAASPHHRRAPVRRPRPPRQAHVQKPRATPRGRHGGPRAHPPARHGGSHAPSRHGGPRHGRGHH